MMRIFYVTVLVMIVGLGILVKVPSLANGFLEVFFPMLAAPQNDPRDTLEAPFADKEALALKAQKGVGGVDSVPIELPHRSKKQIANWLTAHVADSLTFDQASVFDNMRKGRLYFDVRGWEQFESFMVTAKLDQVLQSQRFSIVSFVDNVPLFLNEGVADGRYRWLYEVPIMVSYMKRGRVDYSDTQDVPVTQNMVITVQVGRDNDAENDDGLLIESWSARFLKASQNEL